MISKQEIIEAAAQLNLPASTVEKDYVLGRLLAGIATNTDFGANWAFKGGTCLRKCYFQNYRFSEDLDFTMLDRSLPTQNALTSQFKLITKWVYRETGIEFPDQHIEHYRNPRGTFSCQGRLYYRGPLRRKANLPKIKLDLTAFEAVIFPTEVRPILHRYTDASFLTAKVMCYSLDEIFSEKMRALIERSRPRDLYDVVEIYQQKLIPLGAARVHEGVARKCRVRRLPLPIRQTVQARCNANASRARMGACIRPSDSRLRAS